MFDTICRGCLTLSADLVFFFETKSQKIKIIWKMVGCEWGEPNLIRIFLKQKQRKIWLYGTGGEGVGWGGEENELKL